jgi:hypothetical protein
MKKIFLFLSATFSVCSFAQADQKATMTCKGRHITLEQKSPYMGENSSSEQNLYILKENDNSNESRNTAYFLNVEEDIGGKRDCFGAGSLIFTGKNEVGGKFRLCMHVWTDESEGTVIRSTSSGIISYSHGPLVGQDEPVSCVLE